MPQYFTEETDQYIRRYLNEENEEEKHKLFNEGIRPAFEKLIENQIYVYSWFKLDDVETLKQDCLSNLYELLPKFDPDRGKKGFSYFNVVTKNWFIHKSRERVKKIKVEQDLHVDINEKSIRQNPALYYSHDEEKIVNLEFYKSLFEEMDFWRLKLQKENELKVLESVIYLLQNPQFAPIYNKKAVYIYLRDMTGLNEKQIATILKKMKELYVKWKPKFFDGEK